MTRLKCTTVPSVESCVDIQLTAGRYYNVLDIKKNMDGIIFYTVVGDDGVEVERDAQFFSKPRKKMCTMC